MTFYRTIKVDAEQAALIEKFTTVEPKNQDGCLSEDETITETATFPDGVEMDIKCCGVQYKEGEKNLAWTEAVLFQNGCEICCSEISDEFFGEWELEALGNTYVVTAKKNDPEENRFEDECYKAYQLDWMMSHGYGLKDLMDALSIVGEDIEEDEEQELNDNPYYMIHQVFSAFEYDHGFGSQIYACKEEFLQAEYLDKDYMAHLLSAMPFSDEKRKRYTKYTGITLSKPEGDLIVVPTTAGVITAEKCTDPGQPGISITLQPAGTDFMIDMSYVTVTEAPEYQTEDKERPEDVVIMTYGDIWDEDYTSKVVIRGEELQSLVKSEAS